MKIAALMENIPYREDFLSEHGLSLFIETEERKILFDTGQTDNYIDNAKKLGINLEDVDMLIISHGHYDHSGGIKSFLKINEKAKIYISQNAFGEYYNGIEKYIGMDKELQVNERFELVGDYIKLDENIELFSCNDKRLKYEIRSAGLKQRLDGEFIPDMFRHEQYLVISEKDRKYVISGCSHKGILNIMNWLKPNVLIGGFHFMKEEIIGDKNDILDKAAKELMKYNTEYYTCHCTGIAQYEYMKK